MVTHLSSMLEEEGDIPVPILREKLEVTLMGSSEQFHSLGQSITECGLQNQAIQILWCVCDVLILASHGSASHQRPW